MVTGIKLEIEFLTSSTEPHWPQQWTDGIDGDNWGAVKLIARADQLTKLQWPVSWRQHMNTKSISLDTAQLYHTRTDTHEHPDTHRRGFCLPDPFFQS